MEWISTQSIRQVKGDKAPYPRRCDKGGKGRRTRNTLCYTYYFIGLFYIINFRKRITSTQNPHMETHQNSKLTHGNIILHQLEQLKLFVSAAKIVYAFANILSLE
jgi:hypothetical protein